MRKLFLFALMTTCLMMLKPERIEAQDLISEVIKAGIIKAIKAVDLKIQRLQTETIWLQNAQKVVENTMARVHLTEIADWAEKQRTLYSDYFSELWKVKSIISHYYKIREIINTQKKLIEEYKRSFALFKQDKHFSQDEINYIGDVYSGILNESVKNLNQIFLVINSFSTQMSDANRLKIIDGVAAGIADNLKDLQVFKTKNILLSLQRSKSQSEIDVMKKIYGIE